MPARIPALFLAVALLAGCATGAPRYDPGPGDLDAWEVGDADSDGAPVAKEEAAPLAADGDDLRAKAQNPVGAMYSLPSRAVSTSGPTAAPRSS